ncbi:MAG: PEP-CTERM system histidine kinase PrsK [Nitrospirales bacterium]|nr:PEP-CTERM system histidine kinase PrsK [Nitrospira sp.]MDR4501944.1 PEP-CTERM system histidine kinase PrsK [Nitrospirales bacterium]
MIGTIPCFLSGGAALSLTALIIWQRKQGRVFLALLAMMAITAWVQITNGLSLILESQHLLWRQMSLLGEIFWPVAIYHVACSFTQHMSLVSQQTVVWRFRALLAVGVVISVFLLSFPDMVMTGGVERDSVVFHRPWGRMIWGFILVGLILALAELEHVLRVSRDPLRYQIKFVVIGVGGMSVIALVQASQMLLFSVWQQEYTWMAAIAVLLSVGLVAYGLSRWGTEDLSRKLFVSPQVIYTSLTFLIVGVYLVCVGLVVAVVRQTDWEISSALGMLLLFVAGLILVVVMFSRQVRAELQAFIANNFYRSKYDYRRKWLQLTDSFSACRSLEEILDEFLNILSRTFGAPKVTIWVKFQTDNRYHQVRSLTTGTSHASIPHQHSLIKEFRKKSGPLTFDGQEHSQDENLKSFIADTRAVVCVPLGSVSEHVIGFVTLSEDLHGRQYGRDDLDLLRVMGHHVAMLLTQVKLMDEQRASAEWEAVHKFSAFYLHDLKNLASGLSLVSQNAEMYGHDPEFQAAAMKTIGGTVQRIMSLIGKLSLQVKSPKQEMRGSYEVVDVNSLVSEAIHSLDGTLCQPKFFAGHDLPPVSVIRDEFKHVVLNLLLNAQQALNGDGMIEVRTKCEEPNIALTVKDNGRGIPEEQLRTLFQPFRTTKKKGLGIGLYQCRQIVQDHGGTMCIESEEGKGTCVSIRIPQVEKDCSMAVSAGHNQRTVRL